MDIETKLQLLKLTDSYWTILPEEIKGLILMYRESQGFIERRESASNRTLCKQIRMYGDLRQKWQIGHVECRPIRMDGCHSRCAYGDDCEHMRIYGHYWDLRGTKREFFWILV